MWIAALMALSIFLLWRTLPRVVPRAPALRISEARLCL
jgi:hypothetical protein